MFLKINNEDLELIYSFRSSIYFEQISGHAIDFNIEKFTSNDLLTLFYCTVIASLQKKKKPIISLDDFMDVIDDNGGDKCIYEFSKWYIETMKAQYDVSDADLEKEEKKSQD